MMILDSLFPIFALLFLGSILKHFNVTNPMFLKTSDRLVYYIFFPAMLFWKIGKSLPDEGTGVSLCVAAMTAVILTYALSLGAIHWFRLPRYKAGAFSQACYRFNTYIGMAIVMNSLGEEGVRYFGLLIGVAIPMINVLAVSTLIWFSGEKKNFLQHRKYLLKALVSNPLILGCLAGLLFSRTGLSFPVFMDNTFNLMTSVTMPLALISIGGSLTLSGLKHNIHMVLTASVLKILVLPLLGALVLKLFSVTGIPFKVGMIFFSLPTSTAIYVLSAQLNSDSELASAIVMMTTLLSFFSLSAALLI